MVGSSNFLQFNPGASNALSDSDYNSNGQRTGGLVDGLAQTALHNKAFFQWSVMVYALGQVLANAGYTVADNSVSGLITALTGLTLFSKAIASKNANYTVVAGDNGTLFTCTGTFTLALTAAATLGANWYCFIRNDGVGVITLDPNASETIDGQVTITLNPRDSALLICDGSNFKTIGRSYLPGTLAKSANYTAAVSDMSSLFVCTSTFTLALSAAATLGAGWFCSVRNDGSGVITIDPNGSETIDGLTTITLGPGAGCLIFCDGSGFKTVGRNLEYIHLQDQKAQNTAGGTFTSGAWRTRDLNTEVADTGNNCALASNQFTLQPGTYRIRASAPAYLVNAHQAKLRNITDGSDVLLGTSEYAHGSYALTIRSWVAGQFTITAAKTFELQHQCGTSQSTTGLGQPANLTTEVYSVVELWKVA